MRNDFYPEGTVQALLQTDWITPQTKAVLQERLSTPPVTQPQFFTKEIFIMLQAVCNRLLPQPRKRKQLIDLAGILDTHLANGYSNGWRYNDLPPDEETFTKGIAGIGETAQILYGKGFQDLETDQQDVVLHAVQQRKAAGECWKLINTKLFFEELLAALCEIYYSHPLGKEEIGDVSMADAKGWHYTMHNTLDIQEPQPLNAVINDNQ